MPERVRQAPMGRELAYDDSRRHVRVQLHGRPAAGCDLWRLATVYADTASRHVVPGQEHAKLPRLLGVVSAGSAGVLQRGPGFWYQWQQRLPVPGHMSLQLKRRVLEW